MPMQRGDRTLQDKYVTWHPTQRMPINYPNHDVFLFASFLAACYSRSSAQSLVSMVRNGIVKAEAGARGFRYSGSNIPIVLYNLCRLFFSLRSAESLAFKQTTHWKKSVHIALSPPLRFRHRMLLSAAS
jgi:hypothetical protein